jgi:DNA-binding CsgD family transcriptional regulator
VIRHVSEEEFLAHYGILRKSGRYPWGSGETQSARNKTFLSTVDELRKSGMKDPKIAEGFGMTTTQLRALSSIAVNQQRQEKIRTAQKLKDKGMSNSAIGRQMGVNESTVRSLLTYGEKDDADVLTATADMLRRQVNEKGFVDVGAQVERDLPIMGGNRGVSATKFGTALAILQEEGYEVHTVNVPQLGTGKNTKQKVLTKPGTTQKDVWMHRNEIRPIQEHSDDGGRSYLGVKEPLSVSSKRVGIIYKEDGGDKSDGVIFVRPGVKDLDMGHSRYAQVRIAVDGTHYLKGMAVYKDDMPPGVDLMFNTNKSDTGNKKDAMKKLKDDEDNPFGAVIRQKLDEKGNVISALNIVGSKEGAGEEGGWDTWGKSLPAQMLSKQHPNLAKAQLAVTQENRKREFDELSNLTNPAIRKKLLEDFAEETDSAAVHLSAAAMPRQATKVLLPVPQMKPNEIYAPSFEDGTRVALVRFPHGGTFEIPQVTVNNRVPAAKKLLGTSAKDAIGIHHTVAERLSGADFDGDTVLVIPNNQGKVKSTPPLEGLKGFDPRSRFGPYDGLRTIDGGVYNAKTKESEFPPGHKKDPNRKGREMGGITNLIADMTVHGASSDELARAVRHSMVVIDAEKHHLDFRASAQENGIAALKTKYQGGPTSGARTLITRATAETRVNERKQGFKVDPLTGRKSFEDTGRTVVDRKTGQAVLRTTKSKRLAEVEDAHSLIDGPGTEIERVYADHANALKAMANEARKEAVNTPNLKYNEAAKRVYAGEVKSLDAKLDIALRNAPVEREAQRLANATVALKRQANPGMEASDLKKIKNQALAEARTRTGAGKTRVQIEPSEWEAIQAGAISNNKMKKILANADIDVLRKLATPRTPTVMTSAAQSRAKLMLATGYTQAQVAAQLGVGLSTLKSYISEEGL